MMLPNSSAAVVDIVKLRDYCLSPTHPRGRHKARVFAARLGLGGADAEVLRAQLLHGAATTDEALAGASDDFGDRYVVDLEVRGPLGVALVRTAWIVRADEDFPRFTTCFVVWTVT